MLRISLGKTTYQREGLGGILAFAVFYAGLFLTAGTLFSGSGACLPGMAAGILLLAGCMGLQGRKGKVPGILRRVLYTGMAAASLLLLLFLVGKFTWVYQGALLSFNAFLEKAGQFLGRFLTAYEISVPEEQYNICQALFFLFFGIFLAGICELVRMGRSRGFVLLISVCAAVLELCLEGQGFRTDIFVLALGVLLLWMDFQEEGDEKNRGKSPLRVQNVLTGTGLFLLVFAAARIFGVGSAESAGDTDLFAPVRAAATDLASRLRYGQNTTDSMPRGQFADLGDLKLTEETALQVLMESPSSLYLKGYTGSVYTPAGWKESEKDSVYEQKELFYWLHAEGFSGLSQLAALNRLEHPGEEKDGKVVIKNVGTDRKYVYVPYELASLPEEISGAYSFGDAGLLSEGLVPGGTYQYQAHTNLVSKYPLLASEYYGKQRDAAFAQYSEDESSYNAFVYQQYLEVPDDLRLLFENILGEAPGAGESHTAYEDANIRITGYLNENIRYTEEISDGSKGNDFVQHFLEVSKKGYSVHYASAAVLMYRYLGIPARYVEGYLITPGMAENVGKGQQITITGKSAHAWAEIYQDGVGWIPMEVTPPYLDVMERPEFTAASYTSGENSGSSAGESAAEEIRDEEDPKPETEKGKKRLPIVQILVGVLAVTFLLLFVLWLFYVLFQRRKLAAYLKSLEDEDTARAVRKNYGRLMQWLFYGGITPLGGSRYRKEEEIAEKFGEAFASEYAAVTAIAEEAAYSTRKISREQLKRVRNLQQEAQRQIVARSSIFRRIRMRVVDFIY